MRLGTEIPFKKGRTSSGTETFLKTQSVRPESSSSEERLPFR